jgi:HSP20 family molecular chaperone IbpA
MANLLVRPSAQSSLIGDFFGYDPVRALGAGTLGLDITKTENGYAVELPVPGFGPEQIEVTLEDRVLTISGKSAKRNFTRAIVIPDEIDTESIEAKVEHGLLTLGLHIHPKAQPRKIDVRFN